MCMWVGKEFTTIDVQIGLLLWTLSTAMTSIPCKVLSLGHSYQIWQNWSFFKSKIIGLD